MEIRPQTTPGNWKLNAKTPTNFLRSKSNLSSRNASQATSRRRDNSRKEDEYTVELLEYEWPDLPPLPCMKDAITRQKVSKGISYVLPVDKGMNSINNQFRTDLRAMFKEPYASDDLSFNDSKVAKSAHVHFDSNAVDVKWTQKDIDNIPLSLNLECEKIRKQYARSAPTNSKKADPEKLRTRSNLFLPMKRVEHPEAQQLREQVDKMLEDLFPDEHDVISNICDEDEDDDDIDVYVNKKPEKPINRKLSYRPSLTGSTSSLLLIPSSRYMEKKRHSYRFKTAAQRFKSYEHFKRSKPPNLMIPEKFKSKFLDQTKNQTIWDWLHYGEEKSDFQFFLSVCG